MANLDESAIAAWPRLTRQEDLLVWAGNLTDRLRYLDLWVVDGRTLKPRNPNWTVEYPATEAVTSTWSWKSTAGTTDPGAKNLAPDVVATPANLRFSTTNVNGVDARNLLVTIATGDTLVIQQKNDSTKWAKFTVRAPITDNTTWFNVPVTVASVAPAGYPSNNADTIVEFTRNSSASSSKWTDTGTALTPNVSTRDITFFGNSASQFTQTMGTQLAKARLITRNTASWAAWSLNTDTGVGTQDDASKVSWEILLRADQDNIQMRRKATSGGAATALLTLGSAGLSVTGTTLSTGTITSGTGQGSVALTPGGAGNTGYVAFYSPTNVRSGYFGFGAGGRLALVANENSYTGLDISVNTWARVSSGGATQLHLGPPAWNYFINAVDATTLDITKETNSGTASTLLRMTGDQFQLYQHAAGAGWGANAQLLSSGRWYCNLTDRSVGQNHLAAGAGMAGQWQAVLPASWNGSVSGQWIQVVAVSVSLTAGRWHLIVANPGWYISGAMNSQQLYYVGYGFDGAIVNYSRYDMFPSTSIGFLPAVSATVWTDGSRATGAHTYSLWVWRSGGITVQTQADAPGILQVFEFA